MRDTKKSGSGIFLMEMIMVCGFFLLCAAVCVRAFVQADSLSRMAREKNQAVLAAQNLGEMWKDGQISGEGELYFDQNWNLDHDQKEAADAWYMAELSCREETTGLLCLDIRLMSGAGYRGSVNTADGTPVLLEKLQVKDYQGEGETPDEE